MNHSARAGFSVLIPAYRAARTIGSTLDAVAAQTLAPREVLIFEDGRFDHVAEIVAGFAARVPFPVRLSSQEKNGGVSRARNILLRQAQGEFVAFLDADDLWTPEHLARAAENFAAGADVVFAATAFIDADGFPLHGPAEPRAEQMADMAREMFRYNFVQSPSALCLRHRLIAQVGLFDPGLSYGEDLDLWLRMLEAGARWKYSGHCTCAYRKHAGSAMAQTLPAVARMAAFYEKHLDNPLIPRGTRRRALINNRRDHARLNWRRHPEEAAAALRRLIRLQPWHPGYAAAWLCVTLRARLTRLPVALAPAPVGMTETRSREAVAYRNHTP